MTNTTRTVPAFDSSLTIDRRGRVPGDILMAHLERGIAKAKTVLQGLKEQTPKDHIVRAKRLHFTARPVEDAGTKTHTVLDMEQDGVGRWGFHRNGIRQLSSHLKIPLRLADFLAERPKPNKAGKFDPEDLADARRKRELLATNFNELTKLHSIAPRYLARTVDNNARAILSPSYGRRDPYTLATAFIEALDGTDATPYDAHGLGTWVNDTRWQMAAVVPRVYTPVKGEAIAYAVVIRDSAFGASATEVSVQIIRLWCTNGATSAAVLKKRHAGSRIEDGQHLLSEKAVILDTKASAAAVRDTVKALTAPESVEAVMETVKQAHDTEMDWPTFKKRLVRAGLTKADVATAEDLWHRDDVVELPGGATAWRASNVLSAMAKSNSDDGQSDSGHKLADLAGGFFKLPKSITGAKKRK